MRAAQIREAVAQSASFLQFGYLSGKEGLLAGEKLQLDVKRTDLAYQELYRGETPMTANVTLLQNDSGLHDGTRSERCLPFEYQGAISERRLELPANPVDDELLVGELDKTAPRSAIAALQLHLSDNTMRDVWVVVRWGA